MIRDHAYVPEEPWHRDACQWRSEEAARNGPRVRVCNAPRALHEDLVKAREERDAEQERSAG